MTIDGTTAVASPACGVLELRQCLLQPGRRDELIELFERELVETQEAAGMQLIGQFRDIDRPDHFVWLRGFADMTARRDALTALYGGPVWAAHRDAANATMIDSDDVLLLRPSATGTGFRLPPTSTRGVTPGGDGSGVVLAAIQPRRVGREAELARYFRFRVLPALQAAGLRVAGIYETESSANTFPRLPVRADANVLVWFRGLAQSRRTGHLLAFGLLDAGMAAGGRGSDRSKRPAAAAPADVTIAGRRHHSRRDPMKRWTWPSDRGSQVCAQRRRAANALCA